MRRVALFIAVLAVLLGMAGTSRAQSATGQITGTVKDTTGAVIAKVKVTVSSQLTGASREAATAIAATVFPLRGRRILGYADSSPSAPLND
jgi:hypothetical protein